MKAAELCAGYNGLGMAVEQVFGAETAWVSEFEDAPSRILAHHYPTVPNHGDMTKIDWAAVEPVEILSGGYPCQPFSAAGRRMGQDDPRHLWPTIAGAIDVLRPKLCVFENVRGHLSLGFDDVVRDLHLLGYNVQWKVNRAADVGAPHGRARIFILAEDRNAPLRSWFDRRGRLHRDSGVGRVFPGEAQGVHDGQGSAGARADGRDLRRQGVSGQEGDRHEPRGLLLGTDRSVGRGCDSASEAALAGEVRTRGSGGQLPGNDRDGREASEWSDSLDGGNARQGPVFQSSDSGSEPEGAGPSGSEAARHEALREAQGRGMVVAGRFPVWSGAFYWHVPDFGANDQWRGLRAADVGAPHSRFRVFVLASLRDGLRRERTRSAWHGRDGSSDDNRDAPNPSSNTGWLGHGDDVPLRGLALGYRSAPGRSVTADAGSATIGEHAGEPLAEEAGTAGRDRSVDHRGKRVAGDGWETVASPAPTDTISGGRDGRAREARREEGQRTTTQRPSQADSPAVAWGEYEPAIRRWEATLGRRAPAPTEPTGRNGGHRLSARFAEWLMGVPDGWIVDVPGITRNEALKAAGNGVVPAQAAAALRDMLANRARRERRTA